MDGHEQVGYNASMHPHDAYTVTAYPATEREIEAEFPGWRVWRTTDAGTWWASRRGPLWNREPRTLAADTANDLRAELREASSSPGAGQALESSVVGGSAADARAVRSSAG